MLRCWRQKHYIIFIVIVIVVTWPGRALARSLPAVGGPDWRVMDYYCWLVVSFVSLGYRSWKFNVSGIKRLIVHWSRQIFSRSVLKWDSIFWLAYSPLPKEIAGRSSSDSELLLLMPPFSSPITTITIVCNLKLKPWPRRPRTLHDKINAHA